MADDVSQPIELSAMSDKTLSNESGLMETAPECTDNSPDSSDGAEGMFSLQSRDAFTAKVAEQGSPELGDIRGMLYDIEPQMRIVGQTHDEFHQARDDTLIQGTLTAIHAFISDSESASEDEVDSLIPPELKVKELNKPCRSCSHRLGRIYNDKTKKLARCVLEPCKHCGVENTDRSGEITAKTVPETASSPGPGQEQRFRLLLKQMKHSAKNSDVYSMNMALTELQREGVCKDESCEKFQKALHRVLFEAILSGKHNIAQAIVAFSPTNVFKAESDLFRVSSQGTDVAPDSTPIATQHKEAPHDNGGDAFTGQTALHLAVSNGNTVIVNQILERFNETEAIDLIDRQATGRFFTDPKKVPEGQYCLFLAAWMGYTDIFENLIHRGASLNVQDTEGNTVLHKLVILSINETETDPDENKSRWVDPCKRMCDILLTSAAVWWRKFVSERHNLKRDLKDAVTYLMSIENDAGFTPMSLAAYIGAAQIYKILINSPAYKTEHLKYGPITDVSFRLNEIDSALCGNDGTSHLESILYNPINKACEFICLEPISTLVSDKWLHYRKYYYSWSVVYILYMVAFTVYSVIRPTHIQDIEDLYSDRLDKFRAFIEVVMVLGIPWYLYGEIQDLCYPRHRRLPDPWKYIQDGFYRIIRIVFVLSLIVWIVLHFANPIQEDAILPLCLFFGWVYVITFTCGNEAFGIFPVMLQRMVFLDLLRFLVIFLLIIFSMTTAMFCLFRSTPNVEEYSTFMNTAFSLFKITVGLQDVSSVTSARHPGIAIFLFVLYVVLGNILLLNILIAMMNASYSTVSEKAPVYRLETLQRAYNTLLVERRLPRRFSTVQDYSKGDGKYTKTSVHKLGDDGRIVKEDEFTVTVQTVDFTPDDRVTTQVFQSTQSQYRSYYTTSIN